ncbi:MAG: hypothetical protein ACI9G1_005300, partial [Pirellulaceae bacterium]
RLRGPTLAKFVGNELSFLQPLRRLILIDPNNNSASQ